RQPMPTSLSVSIINYRTGDLTIACVQSVLEAAHGEAALDVHTVVVDNASGDGSADEIVVRIKEQSFGDRATFDDNTFATLFPDHPALTDCYPFAAS
ncbi:MAG: hypothetical protein AAFY90_06500, partial [Pseudomonadota bacterium]